MHYSSLLLFSMTSRVLCRASSTPHDVAITFLSGINPFHYYLSLLHTSKLCSRYTELLATISNFPFLHLDFHGGLAVKNVPAVQETQEMWVHSLCWEDPLEEGMATDSSILAWRIPWTEEPGGLKFIGLQRVG